MNKQKIFDTLLIQELINTNDDVDDFVKRYHPNNKGGCKGFYRSRLRLALIIRASCK